MGNKDNKAEIEINKTATRADVESEIAEAQGGNKRRKLAEVQEGNGNGGSVCDGGGSDVEGGSAGSKYKKAAIEIKTAATRADLESELAWLKNGGGGSGGGSGGNAKAERPRPAQWADMTKSQRKHWKQRHLRGGSGRE